MSRILFVAEPLQHPACYYRAITPMAALNGLGHDAYVSQAVAPTLDGRLAIMVKEGIFDPDIVVLRRMENDDIHSVITDARKNGQLVFMDVDDNLWNVPKWNPLYGELTPDMGKRIVKQMNRCDGVLTSTPELVDVMREHGVKVPVRIMENVIDLPTYNEYRNEKPHEPFRIGWMGATNYRWNDLETIVPALREALDGADVEFWHYGAHPDLPDVADLLDNDFPVPVRKLEWSLPSMLPVNLAKLDALVIPQVRNDFADCRSAATGLAACASGIPFVATPTPEYERLWRNFGAGYSADTHDQWTIAIRQLFLPEYERWRHDVRMSGYQVARRFNLDHMKMRWKGVLSEWQMEWTLSV